MTPLAAVAVVGCLAVTAGSDQILLRDLVSAFPDTQAMPLETAISLAPMPGAQRRFEIAELRRIALRFKLPEPEREVCFERPTTPLDPARIVEAMQAELPAARIELLDYSRYPVPEGALEFAPAGLRPVATEAFWRGAVRYGKTHRLPIWARVHVTLAGRRIVAVQDLAPGHPIDSSAIKEETREEFPSADSFPTALAEVAGRVLRRPVRSGTAIRSVWLEEAKAVTSGETVQVEVHEGAALLQLPGKAQSSGAIGQTVQVLNPVSKKRFPARVEGKGKVSVGKDSQ